MKPRKFFALALSLALLLGCSGIASLAADTAPFRVVATPYGDGIGLHWYTKADHSATVKIDGAVPGGAGVVYGGSIFQGNYAHSVTVSGLAPGKHTYDIGGVTGAFNINPGKGHAFEFIVTGDTQASDKAGFDYSAATHKAAWARFPDAAFSVILGDHTNDSDNGQWDLFFESFAPVLAKGALVPIAGNHDGNLKWNWFRSMFALKEPGNPFSNMTGVYYSFDYGDAHIAVLNTNDMYPMSAVQQNWFLNDMMQSDAKWKLVFMHRAPYSAGNDANLPDNLIMRRVLIPLFDKAGVDLVMYGHDHQYVRTKAMYADTPVEDLLWPAVDGFTPPAGTVYILPGAACSKRYDIHPDMLPSIKAAMAKHEQPGKPLFTGISIDGGTLTYQAYTYEPETGKAEAYDALTLTKTSFKGADPDYKPLPTDFIRTLPQQLTCFFTMVAKVVFVDYLFGLLPGMIGG
ncbi:MAG: metallophosphoesterase [Oscillospiraceae bacterium]|jgi:predicted phosphodiesterase|nr:metallophosphoesterase [Oscillospiraceae bacterium]